VENSPHTQTLPHSLPQLTSMMIMNNFLSIFNLSEKRGTYNMTPGVYLFQLTTATGEVVGQSKIVWE
jgi:hypothetical protein